MENPTLSYPWGEVDVQAPDYAATIDIAVKNQKTIVNVATLTGALTLKATPASDLRAGAELIVKLTSDTTARDTTLSTGITGTTIAGVISKTKVATFVYDGSTFVHTATQQVN